MNRCGGESGAVSPFGPFDKLNTVFSRSVDEKRLGKYLFGCFNNVRVSKSPKQVL